MPDIVAKPVTSKMSFYDETTKRNPHIKSNHNRYYILLDNETLKLYI